METAKKTYHMACKEEKLAASREADASVTPDQQKKLHEKTEKCKQDVQKVRKTAMTNRIQELFTFKLKVYFENRRKNRLHRTFNAWQNNSLMGIIM